MTQSGSEGRPHILIAGCGYVGQRLAARLRDRYEITALVRSNDKAAALERQGLKTVVIDLDRPRLGSSIPERLDQEAIVYLAPPPGSGESDLRLDRFLHLAFVPPKSFVYMSTTGVYGDSQGALVDESTPVMPLTERARRRVSAEEMTRVWCHERRVRRVVLRVPGIYGPERLPLERLRKSEPVVRAEDAGITNRIHVDDLVSACEAAIENKEARGVYNVTDGNSVSSTSFIDLVADLSGLPHPPRVSMEEAQLTFSPERLSFLNESRRVSNDRMLKHLGVKLRYTDLETGIRASLSNG
ncbi:SDR family oxidoreductase [Peristeroidobacter soli]|jgi:nucleoside-diphosphate-sugar epimerase|uniref:SDR family oxidoreductase n=1 Tax=Peristeroidobacter soli TaxID=2497877 RepID=UPI00101BF45A|nr:SDR family oxidoreductase [Peristeroidobacter soli]